MTTVERRTIERRMFPTEFREVPGSNGRQRWATAVTYNRVDDFGTIWLPGLFNQGLDERMPTILYGHDWFSIEHVLGQGIDYRDGTAGVDVLFEFADPDLVPSAARAMALTAKPNPVLKDVSVGFDRQEWLSKQDLSAEQLAQGAVEAMVRAVMDELSLVVRGAVPGAQMRTRSFVIDGTVLTEPKCEEQKRAKGARVNINGAEVDVDLVVDLAKRRAAGDLSLDDARLALELAGVQTPTGDPVLQIDVAGGPVLDASDESSIRTGISRLESRLVDLFSNDQAAMLRDALDDRFQPGPERYIWVVDFTDVQVIFEKYGFDDSGLYMLGYSIDGDVLTLDAGDEVEVQRHTTYVPETDPAGTAPGELSKPHEVPPVSDAEAERVMARALSRSRR